MEEKFMNPAKYARSRVENFRIIHFDKEKHSFRIKSTSDLAQLIPSGSLLIVNDAATFPARLKAYRQKNLELVELRFFPFQKADSEINAFIMSSYDWRIPTDKRLSPKNLEVGELIKIPSSPLEFEIANVSGRLLSLKLKGSPEALLAELYKQGDLIQYSYHQKKVELYEAQTIYAAEPWAAEMPSAGYFLRADILASLRAAGIEIANLTHQTGLSSSGDAATDAKLPLPEYFCIPKETLEKIAIKKASGQKIIAVGTSVVRALESLGSVSQLAEVCQKTSLKLTKEHKNKWVDGIISGLHSEAESHFELLESFANRDDLKELSRIASDENLLNHEYGDLCLIL
jgi:S-adenosylmethionine:tRNA ribosyltransferase-isomerase